MDNHNYNNYQGGQDGQGYYSDDQNYQGNFGQGYGQGQGYDHFNGQDDSNWYGQFHQGEYYKPLPEGQQNGMDLDKNFNDP